jgi:hypothetical protein
MPRSDVTPDEVNAAGAMLDHAIPADAVLDIDAVAIPAGFSPRLSGLATQITEEDDRVCHDRSGRVIGDVSRIQCVMRQLPWKPLAVARIDPSWLL